jgi:hypothetical protein
MEAIGKLIGIIGVLTFLFTMKQKVDDALAAIRAPESLNFYFLFFWALVAAILGGLFWAFCQQVFPPLASSFACSGASMAEGPMLGGSKEPHGLAAFMWAIVTNLPSAVLLSIVAARYGLLPLRGTVFASTAMLLFLGLASIMFYDFPLFGFKGFRCYVASKHLSYLETEMSLVVIWSALLALVPFLGIYVLSRLGWIGGLQGSLQGFLMAVGLTIGITSAAVGFFVAGYPVQVNESARGITAGIALRVSLFFGFILGRKL